MGACADGFRECKMNPLVYALFKSLLWRIFLQGVHCPSFVFLTPTCQRMCTSRCKWRELGGDGQPLHPAHHACVFDLRAFQTSRSCFDLSDSNDQRRDASSHLLYIFSLSLPLSLLDISTSVIPRRRAGQGRRGGEGRVRPPLASSARCRLLETHPAAPLRCRDGDTPLNHAFGDGFEIRHNRGGGHRRVCA
jgi:hypothetical protein